MNIQNPSKVTFLDEELNLQKGFKSFEIESR